jgi:peroxiredoxin
MPKPTSPANFDPAAAARVLEAAITDKGEKLLEISEASPVLLVFLRHAGCTFCREALADIAQAKAKIDGNGVRVVVVHMGDSAGIEALLVRYGLPGLDRVEDPDQKLYKTFGLKQGRLGQLFGLHVLNRAVLGGALLRHGVGMPAADASQMPGLFLIHRGEIVKRFRHRDVADRPDYAAITTWAAELR